jgi:hypothetical protein
MTKEKFRSNSREIGFASCSVRNLNRFLLQWAAAMDDDRQASVASRVIVASNERNLATLISGCEILLRRIPF